MSEMTFRKTLRMEHAIAENDRTVRGTPVGNCIFQKRDFGKTQNNNFEKRDFWKNGISSASLVEPNLKSSSIGKPIQ